MIKSNKSERISILTPLEQFAFYGFPDFDTEQRLLYFEFDTKELSLILSRQSLHIQVYCALQIGYFKAKKCFFQFSLKTTSQEDVEFILLRYFQNQKFNQFTVTQYEYYFQHKKICELFGYKFWLKDWLAQLREYACAKAKYDVKPNYIAHHLLNFLQDQKIIRPGYTTLQTIVSDALSKERLRLKLFLKTNLTLVHKQNLKRLLENERPISELAALKNDAKNFTSVMMKREREKFAILKPLYMIAKTMLPNLEISRQNISYYSSLASHYTLYDLKRFDEEQTCLYLLCYVFERYQQIHDNLMRAFDFYVKKIELSVKEKTDELHLFNEENNDKSIGKLLLLYVNDSLCDTLTFGEIRKQAFKILPKECIQTQGNKLLKKADRKQQLRWKERDKISSRAKHHIRPLFMKIDFSSITPDNPLLKAINWMKTVFSQNNPLSKEPFDNCPLDFLSARVAPYIITTDENDLSILNGDRYEMMIYRQILKQVTNGLIYIEDSVVYKSFSHELVSLTEKDKIIKTMDIPWFKNSCDVQLDSLSKELDKLWVQFNKHLKQGLLKHLKYNHTKKEILWVKPRSINENDISSKQTFYSKLPLCDIMDVLRFVNEQCAFLSALTPLQPRYNKQKTDDDHLIAVLIAQGMNLGNYHMAETSDISYAVLESTHQQYMRLATLKQSNDLIANAIGKLSIFPHYNIDPTLLYGSVDGQKFEAETPTAKARYSRKYFNKGRGVVAYTLLSNHIPVQCELIGANEHESHFVFDIWYRNTSNIDPDIITGDMHSVNKANFALMHWFGAALNPRFTNLKKELKHIYCGKDPTVYKKFIVQPAGQINKKLIYDEKENIEQVIVTLALKEMNQSVFIKKLCSLPPQNKTRLAIFEFDKLIRSIYTIKCILDPKILINAHRSQNRIESYHNLRASIAKVGGKKSLIGSTDLEIEISNECGRLIANSIIYYNAAIHSRLLEKQFDNNNKKLKIIDKISPVAWQHIYFVGHFTFYEKRNVINIDELINKIKFD